MTLAKKCAYSLLLAACFGVASFRYTYPSLTFSGPHYNRWIFGSALCVFDLIWSFVVLVRLFCRPLCQRLNAYVHIRVLQYSTRSHNVCHIHTSLICIVRLCAVPANCVYYRSYYVFFNVLHTVFLLTVRFDIEIFLNVSTWGSKVPPFSLGNYSGE